MATPPDPLFLELQQAIAGRYSLERELGRGGMGIVYLARDVRLDRPVALKLLPPSRAEHAELRERFVNEARMAARLAHPNIVPIHAVEDAGRFVFYVMRFVDGETLGERLRRVGALAPADASRAMRDIAYALAYAHAQGVIHRDIKPDNILIEADSDRALVTDFGIARLSAAIEGGEGRIVGTPEYVSPEQASGELADGRSDLYSLGAMAYHCVTGRPPFVGNTQEVIAHHLTRPAPRLIDVAPNVPHDYADIVDRALSKLPDQRPATAEAMAEAFSPKTAAFGELPVSLRVWSERGREMKGAYVIWSLFFYGMGTLALVANIAGNGGLSLSGLIAITFCAANSALPWVGHGLWRIAETRRAIAAGATIRDFRKAAALSVVRREEELQYEASRSVHPLARAVRFGTYLAFTSAVGALLAGVVLSRGYQESGVMFAVFGLSTMATVAGALFGLIFPGRRLRAVDPWARLRRWFWNSPLSNAMMRLTSWGLPTHASLPGSWRATEVDLGSATETLFSALSSSERSVLAGLPAVVMQLERHAARAREHVAAGTPGPWAARLEMSVAAIETLRMGLMRMTGGAGPGSITADLEAARELSLRIDQVVAGADEVAQLLDRSDPNQRYPHADPSASAPSTSLG